MISGQENTVNVDDITRQIISATYVSQNVHKFFPDSVFLDRKYTIVAISSDLCSRLGYRQDEIKGQQFSALRDHDLMSWLSARLVPGYFVNERLIVNLKNGQGVEYIVSGFYLGILGPSDMIVLRFDPRSEAHDLHHKLAETRSQIDNFIYRTAHDLRGPLATIQGLMNLLHIRKDDKEVNQFISLINVNCKKLEERLTHLVYLSKAEEEFRMPSFELRVSDIETAVRKTIERNAFVDYLKLWVSGSNGTLSGYNEVLTLSVINNVVMYILSLPIITQANIFLDISGETMLNVRLRAVGFEHDVNIGQVVQNPDGSHYVDVLQRSNFTYLYAALKICTHLRAKIEYAYTEDYGQEFIIIIPTSRHKNSS